jgi:hypothetical protein
VNAPDPVVSRIQEGFAVAALVLGEGGSAPLKDGLVEGTPLAVALEAALRGSRDAKRAFLRAALRPRALPVKAAPRAESRAAARARQLLGAATGGPRARRGFVADPQLVAWLGRNWASALGAEAP